MTATKLEFPKGFLWGTATSSHQVEGNNTNNNWYAWENTPGKIINNQKAGLACDWWGGRWKEDLGNAFKDGQNAHRFSIEWSRIQPSPDKWDKSALDFYREILKWLKAHNMSAVITLHHFSDPLWIYEQGGWANDDTPKYFEKFVQKTVPSLQEFCKFWVTTNEPNGLVVNSYVDGGFPPGIKNLATAARAERNLIRGHAKAYHAIHAAQKDAMVAYSVYYRGMFPKNPHSAFDKHITKMLSRLFNDSFGRTLVDGQFRFLFNRSYIKEAAGTQDYIALQYYSADEVSFNLAKPAQLFAERRYPSEAELGETQFIANVPEGFRQGMQWAAQFGLPIYITENGVEDSLGIFRPVYTLAHIYEMWWAIQAGLDIRGYLHWSQVDNFEWERGWSQRFGLWALDPQTQKRSRRPSADLFADICKNNAITDKNVAVFAPQLSQKIFG